MENFALWGAAVNAIGILLGTLVGLAIRSLRKLKKETNCSGMSNSALSDTVFQGLGLCVLLVGVSGMISGTVNDRITDALPPLSLPGEATLPIILSMVLGSIIGHLLDLDGRITRLGEWIERATKGRLGNVSSGFVSASLLFCVGSMAIVGSLNSGLSHDHGMLYTKTLLDTVSSVVFASTMGIGVGLSTLLVFVYQGSIALLSHWVAPFLGETVIMTMSITGSLLIVALALNMLGVTKIKVMNYVPAVLLPIFLVPLWDIMVK